MQELDADDREELPDMLKFLGNAHLIMGLPIKTSMAPSPDEIEAREARYSSLPLPRRPDVSMMFLYSEKVTADLIGHFLPEVLEPMVASAQKPASRTSSAVSGEKLADDRKPPPKTWTH